MNVNLSGFAGRYYAFLETKKGHRYMAVYTHSVTEKEVMEDFKTHKASFTHVN